MYTHNGSFFTLKIKENSSSHYEMDKPSRYYTKESKSEAKGQTLDDVTYIGT